MWAFKTITLRLIAIRSSTDECRIPVDVVSGSKQRDIIENRRSMTRNEPLNVLLIEDSEDDALLVIRTLKSGGLRLHWQRVQSAESLRTLLREHAWDVIIADYHLPGFDAPAALEMVQQSELDIPFIVVSGVIGEESAVEMMKAGAHDYLMKDNLARLSEAVQREVREAHNRKERRDAEVIINQQLAAIEAVIDGIAIVQEGAYLYVNQGYLTLFGYADPVELVGQPWTNLYSTQENQRFEGEIFPQMKQIGSWFGEATATRKDGSTFAQEISLTLTDYGSMVAVCRDITESKKAEQYLKQLKDYRLNPSR